MAMADTHKDILRSNRADLVDNIAEIARVVNELYEKGTITSHMKEEILEGKHHTATDKKWALLDLLPRRGDAAFDDFHSVLVKCGETIAADILKPRAPQPQQQTDSWPPKDYSSMEVDVEIVAEDNSEMRNLFEKPGSMYYSMQKKPRGRMLLINNEDFSNARNEKHQELEDRHGTDVDATSLHMLFDQLSFKTITEKNLTKEGIRSALEKERQFNHENYDCFVCVILSHGTKGGVFGVDGEVADIQEITDMFNGQNFKTLVGKPKLFFIQACQGKKKDTSEEREPDAPVSGITQALDRTKIQEKPEAEQNIVASTSSAAEHPSSADIFTAEATTPDYISIRNTVHGSWFIQALVYVFAKFAHKEDLASMMTKVNNLVCRRETKNKKYKQVSTFKSSLSKQFYFFPGLFEKTT